LRPFFAVAAAISSSGLRIPELVSQIGVQHAFDFGAARWQVVAFVEHRAGAAQVAERGRDALAVRAVGEHERMAVARQEAAQHRLDAIAAAALQRHAVVFAGGITRDFQQARAQLRGHRPEVAIPRAPVAQHRLPGRERGGERPWRQQIRFAAGRRGARGD
jgi:hypothetical protein